MLTWQKGYGLYYSDERRPLKIGDEVRVVVSDDTLMSLVVSNVRPMPKRWGYNNVQMFKLDFMSWLKNEYDQNKESFKVNK
jgi:hypothetical protein